MLIFTGIFILLLSGLWKMNKRPLLTSYIVPKANYTYTEDIKKVINQLNLTLDTEHISSSDNLLDSLKRERDLLNKKIAVDFNMNAEDLEEVIQEISDGNYDTYKTLPEKYYKQYLSHKGYLKLNTNPPLDFIQPEFTHNADFKIFFMYVFIAYGWILLGIVGVTILIYGILYMEKTKEAKAEEEEFNIFYDDYYENFK